MRRVLVIDPDLSARSTVQQVFGADCEVVCAHDAFEGVDAAQREQPELILCATRLDRMNGWTVAGYLKQNSQTANIPIVMMGTGDTLLGAPPADRALVSGFVRKPIWLPDLIDAIREARLADRSEAA